MVIEERSTESWESVSDLSDLRPLILYVNLQILSDTSLILLCYKGKRPSILDVSIYVFD